MKELLCRMCVFAASALISVQSSARSQTADEIIAVTGIDAGLCVHVGTTDGALETGFARKNGRILAYGLAPSEQTCASARAAIMAANLYGLASVEHIASLSLLPFPDNLVNLLIVDLDALSGTKPPIEEIKRVVVPGRYGAAYVKSGGSWQKHTKQVPSGMGEWTHWHGVPEGTCASADAPDGPPNGLQWYAAPWATKSMYWSSPTGLRVGDGRVAYMTKPNPQSKGIESKYPNPFLFTVGRDAFSGVQLWSRKDIDYYRTKSNAGRDGFVIAKGMLITWQKPGLYMAGIDLSTGETRVTYSQGLTFATGDWVSTLAAGDLVIQTVGEKAVALNIETGAKVWERTIGGTLSRAVASLETNRYFVLSGGAPDGRWTCAGGTVYCLNLQTGAVIWSGIGGTRSPIAYHQDGYLAVFRGSTIAGGTGCDEDNSGMIGVYRADNGAKVWEAGEHASNFANMVVWNDYVIANAQSMAFYKITGGLVADVPDGYNDRCAKMTGNANWVHAGYVTWVNKTLEQTLHPVTRGSCATGVHAAYNMSYFQPSSCGCPGPGTYRGWQAHVRYPKLPRVADKERLVSAAGQRKSASADGVKLRQAITATGPIVDDWRTTNFGVTEFPAVFDQFQPDTMPDVVAGNTVYKTFLHEHRVEAHVNGTPAWSFVTGGRLWSPPTIGDGKVYIGSADGWVYCVNATSGALLWKYFAALGVRKVMVSSQLESAWPVYGTHLHKGVLYTSAGRHSDLDGGMRVYALNPVDGTPYWAADIRWDERALVKATESRQIPWRLGAHDQFPTATNDKIRVDSLGMLIMRGVKIDPSSPKGMVNGLPVDPIIFAEVGVDRHAAVLSHRNTISYSLSGRGIVIKLAVEAPLTVSLYSVSGARLRRYRSDAARRVELPISGLANGRYFVEIRTAGSSTTKELLLLD